MTTDDLSDPSHVEFPKSEADSLWMNLDRVRHATGNGQDLLMRLGIDPWSLSAPDDIRAAWLKITSPDNLWLLLERKKNIATFNLMARKYLEQAILESQARQRH